MFMQENMVGNVTMGVGGRIVIPVAYREALHLKPGEKLSISIKNGSLQLTSRQQALKKLQEMMMPYKDKSSMTDDFLANRRKMWGEE